MAEHLAPDTRGRISTWLRISILTVSLIRGIDRSREISLGSDLLIDILTPVESIVHRVIFDSEWYKSTLWRGHNTTCPDPKYRVRSILLAFCP